VRNRIAISGAIMLFFIMLLSLPSKPGTEYQKQIGPRGSRMPGRNLSSV
jgi:hypothetical protein